MVAVTLKCCRPTCGNQRWGAQGVMCIWNEKKQVNTIFLNRKFSSQAKIFVLILNTNCICEILHTWAFYKATNRMHRWCATAVFLHVGPKYACEQGGTDSFYDQVRISLRVQYRLDTFALLCFIKTYSYIVYSYI